MHSVHPDFQAIQSIHQLFSQYLQREVENCAPCSNTSALIHEQLEGSSEKQRKVIQTNDQKCICMKSNENYLML